MSIERTYWWLVGGASAVLALDLVDWLVNDDADAVWMGVGGIALMSLATLSHRRYLRGEQRAARQQALPEPNVDPERHQNGVAAP